MVTRSGRWGCAGATGWLDGEEFEPVPVPPPPELPPPPPRKNRAAGVPAATTRIVPAPALNARPPPSPAMSDSFRFLQALRVMVSHQPRRRGNDEHEDGGSRMEDGA